MNEVIFYVIVSDNYFEQVGTPKLISSFSKFHPDISLKIFRQAEINQTFAENPWINWDLAKATFGKKLASDYKLVVNLDADQIVTGELNEIFKEEWEIASVMNNNEYDLKATRFNVPWQCYVNAGLIASRNKDFWDLWEKETMRYGMTTGFREQDVLNDIFWSGRYTYRVLDALDQNVYYGTSTRGQWDKMYMEGDKLMLNNKQVKIIHSAGGHYLPKLDFEKWNLNPQVLERLNFLAS